ncbi:MAG: biotin--[acetyl-CoA-carboxylase] ligase [Candidatus Omnitrophica bacterium]|nr:biotin--[acetyl-CoA-carboxylase] ligase [Candidatus Omnitrophota bacterium]
MLTTQEKVLDFLKRKQGFISGDHISQRLQISRQALWKHIQELKELGYEIVAVPHLGYQLTAIPDRLLPLEIKHDLRTTIIAKHIHYFSTIPSTMNEAMARGLRGAAEGTLVVSETQTKGRGRLGRVWSSPKYQGLYFSLLLRPKTLPAQAATLTLLAAVSICDAIRAFTSIDAQIKWPNDILIAQKKVGGILTELNAEMDRVNFINIGVGLNVNNDKKNLVPGSTSLREEKKAPVSRIALLQEILRTLEKEYSHFQRHGPIEVIEKWRHYSVTLHKRVKVYYQKDHVEGQALDIDTDGGLLIRQDSGLTRKVMAGDVMHCR